ncbi:hypothetical protein D3C75_970250 [compost metagenome]
MGSGDAYRYDQIGAFRFLRYNRPVADGIRGLQFDIKAAFRADMPVFIHIVLGVMRVHGKGAHPDGIRHRVFQPDHMLRHHIIAYHSAGLSDVQLGSPMARLGKFIKRQAPRLIHRPDLLRHTRMVLDGPDIPLLINHVVLPDLFPRLVIRLGIAMVHPVVVRGDAAVIIGIRLIRGDQV